MSSPQSNRGGASHAVDAEVLKHYTEAFAHLSGMPCCPGCGALAEDYTLVAAEGDDPDAGPPWRCTECGLVFDELGEG
jgi:rubredoxin